MENSAGINLIALYAEFAIGYVALIIGISSENKIKSFWYGICRFLITWILVTIIFGGLVYLSFGFTLVFNVVGIRYLIVFVELLITYYIVKKIIYFIDEKFNHLPRKKPTRKKRNRG
jgi:hypothetical protein